MYLFNPEKTIGHFLPNQDPKLPFPPKGPPTKAPPKQVPTDPPKQAPSITISQVPKQTPSIPPSQSASIPAIPSSSPPTLTPFLPPSESTNGPSESTSEPALQPSESTNDSILPTQTDDSDTVRKVAKRPHTKDNNQPNNIKETAIVGIIIVGISGILAFIFFVYRYIRRRNDFAKEITSSIYSTDEISKTDLSQPVYPFSTRSNSFSNNTMQQPSRAPVTNLYDNNPPIRNGGFGGPRPEYYNYYNEGGYTRQNENAHIRSRLQQTRGNVVIKPTPPPPPPPQQNHNWNYGVSAPTNQSLPMNQGGLFPIPSIRGNYGGSSSNNMNGGNNNISTIDYTSNHHNYKMHKGLSVNDNDPKMDDRLEDIQVLKDYDKSASSSTYSEPEYPTKSFSTTKTVQAKLSKSNILERNDSHSSQSSDSEAYHLNAPLFKNNNNNNRR